MPKNTDVIHDWWALRSFLVLPVKKSDMSVKYKRLTINLYIQDSNSFKDENIFIK